MARPRRAAIVPLRVAIVTLCAGMPRATRDELLLLAVLNRRLRRQRRRRGGRWLVVVALVVVVVAAAVGAAAFGGSVLLNSTCSLSEIKPAPLSQNSFVYAGDGSLLGSIPSARS